MLTSSHTFLLYRKTVLSVCYLYNAVWITIIEKTIRIYPIQVTTERYTLSAINLCLNRTYFTYDKRNLLELLEKLMEQLEKYAKIPITQNKTIYIISL